MIQYDREQMYDRFSCFNLKSEVNLSDVEQWIETYWTNRFRRELKALFDSYEDYIESFDINIDIHKIMPMEFSRVAELS